MRYFLLAAVALFISGCQSSHSNNAESTEFGIKETQFKQLNAQQQHQVISAYERQQEIRAKNEPMNGLVALLDNNIKERQSRTTVQIQSQTVDQPIRECHKEGDQRICTDTVQTAENKTTHFNWDFDKA